MSNRATEMNFMAAFILTLNCAIQPNLKKFNALFGFVLRIPRVSHLPSEIIEFLFASGYHRWWSLIIPLPHLPIPQTPLSFRFVSCNFFINHDLPFLVYLTDG